MNEEILRQGQENLFWFKIGRLRERRPIREVILDMDSSVSETCGEQEGSGYNGHFCSTCYHPLFCFNQFGDVEQTLLRKGNVHSAEDWRDVLEPVVARYRGLDVPFYFRADAGFANREVYEFLESEGYGYAVRLPANEVLHREITPLLARPVGRPANAPHVRYADFQYQAQSWNRARRVLTKAEWHKGELFPRVGFIVTNFLRQAVLPRAVRHGSLTTLREKLIKFGAKVVRHSRQVVFQVAVPRELFRAILEGIDRLRIAKVASG